jgi:hypothetical protein
MDTSAEKLISTTREDVLQTMEYAMKFRRGKATRAAQDVAVSALAAMVLEHLELCGFVIMRRPPSAPHSTPGSGIPMKD